MGPTQDPDELLRSILDHHKRLSEAREPMPVAEQRAAAEVLADAFNHYSELVRTPGGANALMRVSAQQHRAREAHAMAHQQLEAHRVAVKSLFEGADQYLRALQLGGFAALFAVWGFTREMLSPGAAVAVGLLLTLSASAFALWEVAKATVGVLAVRTHFQVGEGSIEDFLRRREFIISRARRLHDNLPKARLVAWLFSVVPALAALGLLVGSLVVSLIAAR